MGYIGNQNKYLNFNQNKIESMFNHKQCEGPQVVKIRKLIIHTGDEENPQVQTIERQTPVYAKEAADPEYIPNYTCEAW